MIKLGSDWHRGRKWPVDHGNRGGDITVEMLGRWVRLAIYAGSSPGSNIGFWCTRVGDFKGVNLRVGRRYIGPCVTFLAHTRPSRRSRA